jgi:hypothetical protein
MSVSLSAVADDIDRLITLDINRRGVIQVLHDAARRQTGRPLVLAAADTLASCCTPRSVVLIASGWPDRPWVTPEIGELDGPPGAALLARSLHRVLGIVPFFLIEKELLPAMHATARSAGFSVLPPDQALSAFDSEAPIHAASVLEFPSGTARAIAESERLITTYHPAAVIAIEKGSANRKGIIHNARGQDTTASMAKVDELVREARRTGVPSIGIGDGGNEIGMGMIADTVREHVRFGDRCACPCGGGIAPLEATDVLVTASVSNWGAYGIAACLAVLTNQPNALHNEQMELRTLREAADAGLIDGNTGYVDPGADGIPAPTHAAIITLLTQLVSNALTPVGLAVQNNPNQHHQPEQSD